MNRQLYFVVGDAGLNAGDGIFVQSLEAVKPRLLRHKIRGKWTLVISIHGSQDFIASQVRAIRGGKESYDADAVKRIFEKDQAFVRWRDKNGPSRVVLNACQVGVNLEKAIVESLTMSGSGQAVQGLGTGCRPSTSVQIYEYQGKSIKTMGQYQQLPAEARAQMLEILRGLNKRWGYFGAPSVPDSAIFDYYFTEEPRGGWPIVKVSHNRKDTNIPFYNRASDPEFLSICTSGVGTLREHVPSVPPAPPPRQ